MAFIFDNSQNQEDKKYTFQTSENDSCVLIIDMQEGFRSLQSELITSEIINLIDRFKVDYNFLLFKNENNSLFEKQLGWTKFQTDLDQELMKEFKEFDFPKFWHSSYTIFTEEIKNVIKDSNYKKIYLAGVYTDVSIIKAAMDGFDLGLEMFVFEDATNSLHGQNNHESALDSLKHIIGASHVIKSTDV